MRSRDWLATFALLALAAGTTHAQSTVYRWVDKNGKVQFSDLPPPAEAKSITEKRMGGGPSEDSQLPYATQVAAKRNPVVLYVSDDCGELCKQGRALLGGRGVPYSEKNAQTSAENAEALKQLAGALKVPFLVVGEAKVTGFDEDSWNAALDRAGYLRTRLPGQPAPEAK